MSYKARNYSHGAWKKNVAYNVLRLHQKFFDDGSTAAVGNMIGHILSPASVNNVTTTEQLINTAPTIGHVPKSDYNSEAVERLQGSQLSQTSEPPSSITAVCETLLALGRKAQIRIRETEKLPERGVINAELIAGSLEMRTCAFQERNSLIVLTQGACETEEV